jgi:hypothetical protein
LRFRHAIAEAAGWPMTDVDGRSSYWLPYDELTMDNFAGHWDRVPGDDPLIVFLAHSDCDGVIHPEHGVHIAKRLREIAPLLPEEGSGHIRSMRDSTIQFAEGLEAAAAAGEDVEFY